MMMFLLIKNKETSPNDTIPKVLCFLTTQGKFDYLPYVGLVIPNWFTIPLESLIFQGFLFPHVKFASLVVRKISFNFGILSTSHFKV